MGVAKYCAIDAFVPNAYTLKALKKIEKKALLSKQLMHIATTPLIQLFASPGTREKTIYDIAAYDWEGFSAQLKSIAYIHRELIGDIAQYELLMNPHKGDDKKFWECVSNVTR
ncbi:hypothetical protein [Endozoicomonas numazuensis]|uniref:Uncharacterized protein n=1 Tax=Endozoicomonas numazuensis TaxID=1137799 RepID=A0A081N674_9GAMM|nr:hypothetical protein [Endozoicomonas numazuensis]KEQ13947.1 hypothetical protein GZ78_25175 [Endozoicomonas numazuensis]